MTQIIVSTRRTVSLARSAFGLFILAIFSVACSGGGGSGGGGEAGGISKLSPEQQQAYQAWLKAPVKSCQAIEIVGGGATSISDGFEGGPMTPPGFPGFPSGSIEPTGIGVTPAVRGRQNAIEKGLDLKVLAERTGGSLWLSNTSKADFFALLSGGATGFTTGSSTSKFEQTVTINGSSQAVKVETRSSGFDCIVKINDVEVAQVAIAKSVDLALAGSMLSKFEDVVVLSKDAWLSYDAVTSVPVSTWMRSIDSTMRQDESAAALAVGLGYSEAEAKRHFVVRGSNANGGFGLELSSMGGRIAFAGNAEVVLDASQARLLPEPGQSKTFSVVSMYRTGGLSIGGVRFGPGSNDVMTIRRQVSVTNLNSSVTIRDLGVRMIVSMVPTPEMADSCVFDRAANYSNLYKAKLRSRFITDMPSRSLVFGACEPLEPEIQARYTQSDLTLRVLNTLLAGVTRGSIRDAGSRVSFTDWTSFLASEVIKALDSSSNSKLVRAGDVPILSDFDGYITTARLTPEFAKMDRLFLGSLSSLIIALGDSFRGPAIEHSTLRRWVQSAEKVGPVYLRPIERMVQYAPHSMQKVEDALSWIELSATPTLLQVGREALIEAQAIGYEKFQSDFENFFTLHPSEQDLTLARDEMRILKTQLAAYPALATMKRDVVQAVYKNPKFDSKELTTTLAAASQLVGVNDALAREYLSMVKASADVEQIKLSGDWALKLKSSDGQSIREFLAGALAGGFFDEAQAVVRSMVRTRPTSLDLAAFAAAAALSKQFLVDEKVRATGSTGDVFYESEAQTLAKRIALEGFSASDIAALESMAQVAGSDNFCRGRKTISYRLKCEDFDAFSKKPGKMFAPELQGRNVRLATAMAGWMNVLKPETDHSSIRRTLKNALFSSDSGPWAKCDLAQFDVNSQALAKTVEAYIQVMGDFSARFRAERAVSNVVDARCP